MIELIRNVEGSFVTNVVGSVNYVHSVNAEIQKNDYINIYGLTCFLQNLSATEDSAALSIPNLFGYQTQNNQIVKELNFSTCNKKASWYNMQESPEYVALLACNFYFPVSKILTFTIPSFIINGQQLITNTLTYTFDTTQSNWVPAANNLTYSCFSGGTSGFTYTNFVDFLNETFANLGVNYEARLSLVERNVGSNSNNGFYLIYPENDEFYLSTTSSNNMFPQLNLTYQNSSLSFDGYGYYKMTNDVQYDCETNTITE